MQALDHDQVLLVMSASPPAIRKEVPPAIPGLNATDL